MDSLSPPQHRRARSCSDTFLFDTVKIPLMTLMSGSERNIDQLSRRKNENTSENSTDDYGLDTSSDENDDTSPSHHRSHSSSELTRVRSAVNSYGISSLHCHGPLCGSEQFLHIPNAKDMKSRVKNAKLKSQRNLSVSTPAMPPSRSLTPDIEEKLIPHRNQSRNKKFHRIFKQVPTEEKVVNYFVCALLAEILLQGHLYITENYFGFYSNVFGHVTKILIPVNKVVKITKEKTAKIIPNAVGVETEDDKHVFGSLLSRETTFQLMYKVWAKFTNADDVCVRDDSETENLSPDLEIAGTVGDDEEDEESASGDEHVDLGSGSSSESGVPSGENDSVIGHHCTPSPSNVSLETVSIKTKDSPGTPLQEEARLFKDQRIKMDKMNGSARTLASKLYSLPRSTFLLIVATIVLVFLFLSAALLINRLNTLHYKITSYNNWNAGDQGDLRSQIFQEVFKWQHQLHDNCINDVQDTLNIRIQQLIEVRRSLQTLLLLLVPENLPRTNNKHSET